jgi:hypothetical protein
MAVLCTADLGFFSSGCARATLENPVGRRFDRKLRTRVQTGGSGNNGAKNIQPQQIEMRLRVLVLSAPDAFHFFRRHLSGLVETLIKNVGFSKTTGST